MDFSCTTVNIYEIQKKKNQNARHVLVRCLERIILIKPRESFYATGYQTLELSKYLQSNTKISVLINFKVSVTKKNCSKKTFVKIQCFMLRFSNPDVKKRSHLFQIYSHSDFRSFLLLYSVCKPFEPFFKDL